MANQKELDECYMEVAKAHAALSKGKRAKVGACLVTQNGVVLGGCNGLAPGGSNELEYEEGPFNVLVTKEEVIHAELSCILKAAREGVSVVGSTLYVTMSCCVRCSEMIAAAGVKRVVYESEYRNPSGIHNLITLGVGVEQWES
jgi:dCMP deaminase